MWGTIFIESSGAGFPMEFIGDAHDSTLGGAAISHSTLGAGVFSGDVGISNGTGLPRAGRGIN